MNHPTKPLAWEETQATVHALEKGATAEQIAAIRADFAAQRDEQFPGWKQKYDEQFRQWAQITA